MNIIMFLDRECNSIKNLYESKYCEPRSLRELGNNPKNLLSHLSKSETWRISVLKTNKIPMNKSLKSCGIEEKLTIKRELSLVDRKSEDNRSLPLISPDHSMGKMKEKPKLKIQVGCNLGPIKQKNKEKGKHSHTDFYLSLLRNRNSRVFSEKRSIEETTEKGEEGEKIRDKEIFKHYGKPPLLSETKNLRYSLGSPNSPRESVVLESCELSCSEKKVIKQFNQRETVLNSKITDLRKKMKNKGKNMGGFRSYYEEKEDKANNQLEPWTSFIEEDD